MKNPAAVALGKMKSAKKAAAARKNGKKGGRWLLNIGTKKLQKNDFLAERVADSHK